MGIGHVRWDGTSLETQEYMSHFNPLNSTKNSTVDAPADCCLWVFAEFQVCLRVLAVCPLRELSRKRDFPKCSNDLKGATTKRSHLWQDTVRECCSLDVRRQTLFVGTGSVPSNLIELEITDQITLPIVCMRKVRPQHLSRTVTTYQVQRPTGGLSVLVCGLTWSLGLSDPTNRSSLTFKDWGASSESPSFFLSFVHVESLT